MLYIIFQYDWEPVLIQRILIGFKAILEKVFNPPLNSPYNLHCYLVLVVLYIFFTESENGHCGGWSFDEAGDQGRGGREANPTP